MNFLRLKNRAKELDKLFMETKNSVYVMEEDCIAHLFEAEGFQRYNTVLNFAEKNGFKRVFDIGCAFGHQSEIFLNSNVDYVGINDSILEFWNRDRYKYISAIYPIHLKADEDDLAVSILCLTWNCYLYEGEKTLQAQCEQLKKDFKHCLLYIAEDKIDFVLKYYENYELLSDGFIYFYNN